MHYSYLNAKNETYFLHMQDVQLRNGVITQRIYFFCKKKRNSPSAEPVVDLPDGMRVIEVGSGLPLLKKVR